MTTEPYASARWVFWIVGQRLLAQRRPLDRTHARDLADRPAGASADPASWLNQIEIYFSIVQRKVIKPHDFADLDALAERLLAFQDRYNAAAEPFNWRFGRKSLDRLLERLAIHEPLAA